MALHPALHRYLIEARVQEIRRHGRRLRSSVDQPDLMPITIRRAVAADAAALARLAALAGTAIPRAPVLVAEADGRVHAACAIGTGATIADPRHPGGHAAQLLALRASQLTGF